MTPFEPKHKRRPWRMIAARICVRVTLFLIATSFLPYWLCSRGGDDWYAGDLQRQRALARTVAADIRGQLQRETFSTGSSQFNGEWLFGTYMMAAMGFGQSALEHPELASEHVPLMETCIDRLLTREVKAFDTETWGSDPIASLDSDDDHAAYLGYLNLALSLNRLLSLDGRHAPLNDRITAALIRRLSKSRIGLIQSYPYEAYPVDNCCVVGSIGLHAKATGADHRQLLSACSDRFRKRYVDEETGLLYQSIDPDTGKPIDLARGSGTALDSGNSTPRPTCGVRLTHEAKRSNS